MNLTISGRHVAVTDAMREHARERAERLAHFSPHLSSLKVTLTIEGERHEAEVIAVVQNKGEHVAKSVSHDMYRSIDQALSKVERQLDKVEARTKDSRRRSAGKRKAETQQP